MVSLAVSLFDKNLYFAIIHDLLSYFNHRLLAHPACTSMILCGVYSSITPYFVTQNSLLLIRSSGRIIARPWGHGFTMNI